LLKPRVVVATYSDGIAPVDTCSAEHSCGPALPFASLRHSCEGKKDWRSRPLLLYRDAIDSANA
jgi:hypothetical protein